MKINKRTFLIFLLLHQLLSCTKSTYPTFDPQSMMNVKEFWRVIDYALENSGGNQSLQEKLIIKQLVQYSPEQIIEFELIFREFVIKSDDYKILAAEYLIEGGLTDDSYLYFRCWLIGQGEETFYETLKNPDYLVNVVDKNTFIEFEMLLHVATSAFLKKTGKKEEDDNCPRSIALKKGLSYDFNTPPTTGVEWNIEELPDLYPKLWSKFR